MKAQNVGYVADKLNSYIKPEESIATRMKWRNHGQSTHVTP